MRFKSTLFWFAAAVFVLCFYLYDIKQEEKKKETEKTAKTLFRFSADDVESIALVKGGETIMMQKKGDGDKKTWEIVAPIHTWAEGFVVDDLMKRLANLKYERIMTENADDLAQFGLDPPAFGVTFKTTERSGRISFGTETPIEYGTYTRIDEEKKVYLVETSEIKALDKRLFDLRTKKLFTQNIDDIKRIMIDRQQGEWTLVKKDKTWGFEDDEDFRMDQQKAGALFIDFLMARASSFETESVRDLRPFGLHLPKARITLSGPDRSETILLGHPSKKAKNRIYAKMQARPQVVTVNQSLLDDLPKDREAIKEKEEEKEEKKDKEQEVKKSD
ncbi:MAG: DUF4340 domain-containing protein [Deltaproteobacteria bacterium]|nr:DUF4340 domain-containing protein [Deltaproteobacteria bacterium]